MAAPTTPNSDDLARVSGDDEALLDIGSVVAGRYRLDAPIGAGGYATVYRATDLEADREVAFKLLDIRVDPEARRHFEQRFEREAQSIEAVRHPNIVGLYDHGLVGGLRVPFIAMELLEGHELEEELDTHGALEPTRALRLFRGALAGLAAAHAKGVVHRDLKPPNLFVRRCPDGLEQLVVLDFGIAHVNDAALRLTATGQLMGTPQYLAPEWIEKQQVSPALDVYQMGLILVEMLTGRPVIDETSAYECMVAHCQQRYNIPMELLESPLGVFLSHALVADPEQRYTDAAQMAAALDEIDPLSIPDLRFQTISVRQTLSDIESSAALLAAHRDGREPAPGDTEIGRTTAPHHESGDIEAARLFETGPTRLAPRPRISGRAVAAVAALAVAVVIISLVGWQLGRSPADAVAATDTDTEAVAASVVGSTPDTALTRAPTVSASTVLTLDRRLRHSAALGAHGARAAAAATPAVVRLRIVSDPPGAVVYRNDQRLGETPLEISEPTGTETLELFLYRDGFHPERVFVDALEDGAVIERELRAKVSRKVDATAAPRRRGAASARVDKPLLAQ